MFRPRSFAALACALTLVAGGGARADDCDFELDADLTLEPGRVLIGDGALGEVEISADRELTIAGRSIALDERQRTAVGAYAEQLREVVPILVETALEGAEVGITAASEVLAAILGEEIPDAIRASLGEAREEVRARVGREDEVWFVHRGGIRSAGGEEDPLDAIGPAIERAVSDSIGAMFIALGRNMQSGEGSLEERMTAFAERMEGLDEEIETKVEGRVSSLEDQAEVLCTELQVLALRERLLRKRVPELSDLRVLDGA